MPRLRALALPALLSALLLAPAPAEAWSERGHRLVGALAERQVQPATRAAIDALLADEPEPTLAGIAAWPDRIRGEPRWRHTAPWHYVNFPDRDTCTYAPARDCPDGRCIVGGLATNLAVLRDPAQPREARRDALSFVVHLVGDIHQPMHAGLREDRGGNDHQLRLDATGAPPPIESRGTNLHALWDGPVLMMSGLDEPAYVEALDARRWSGPDATTGSDRPFADWAEESCRLIREHALYPPGRTVRVDYLERLQPVAEQRVLQASTRLARLLDEALAPAAE